MSYAGVVLHDSVCPSINGKGYDFFITTAGSIIPGFEETSPNRIHICVEGDFGSGRAQLSSQQQEQLFVVNKLLLTLSKLHGFAVTELSAHNDTCPGLRFPWRELVISHQDGYH